MRDGACPLMFQPWGAKNMRMWMGPSDVRKEPLCVLQNKKYTWVISSRNMSLLFFLDFFNIFEKYFQSLRFTLKEQQTYQINIW